MIDRIFCFTRRNKTGGQLLSS